MQTRWTVMIGTLAAAGTAAAAAVVLTRRRRRTTAVAPETEWTCACGQRFRVSGTGRHRVLWVEGAAPDDPVVGDRCPACDRPLHEDGATADGPPAGGGVFPAGATG
jgi:hypothetical protein